MTYDEAIQFWYSRINYEVRSATPQDLKLERMQAFLHHLGSPHDRLRIVHITGTKGKGSTAAMIGAILQAAGHRVGLFTSPHLVHVEERTQVNGVNIGPEELAAIMTRLAAVAPADLTFFELSTALALVHFVQHRCEWVVLEVGLGGRFDSTNVCRPVVSVITSVGFDHQEQLGKTLPEIAYQKAGIIKPGVPVICGVSQPEALPVIAQVCREQQAPCWQLGAEIQHTYAVEPHTRQPLVSVQVPGLAVERCPLRLVGQHQAANAALAVATIAKLRELGVPIPTAAVTTGLATVHWPARIECLRTQPTVILDTAHNVPSVEALLQALAEYFPVPGQRRVVFAVSSDKDYPTMVQHLLRVFDVFYLTKYGNNPRSVPPERLAEELVKHRPEAKFELHQDAHTAWAAAANHATPDDLVCITGSVFLAGELQDAARCAAAKS